MPEENVLEKTNRINLLFDFYEPLLTEKQRTTLQLYFHDDYSLGEIAEHFGVSRQAIYEQLKRAEQTLDEYEAKLRLLERHERRLKLAEEAAPYLSRLAPDDERRLGELLHAIVNID
ncbi:DNA-binding protein [Gordoniibacillus kamchatkensis]|uniref:UPF0122 protein SD70_31520 n=1 Tax=Gordoniibacillus kamchatkensis TaxID=1590651 RepID=A0ABR5A692_9BACL|nr:YlxM family DNA-binding protein [Paenibacillus sp. VKM B-2647]KIL36569.1 DNA-binding protein [Paenibacillus sp. VKM B-2647]